MDKYFLQETKNQLLEDDMNIEKERMRLLMYNSGVLLICQTILLLLAMDFFAPNKLPEQLYLFFLGPVVANAISVFIRSKYILIKIPKSDRNIGKMKDFFESEYLRSPENGPAYSLKTKYSISRVKLSIDEDQEHYLILGPKFLSKIVKNYGVKDYSY
jgi:hypothetical protein